MSQSAIKRLYLLEVGSMPEYHIPIVCYLLQTVDGQNILIDSGLPEFIPEEAKDFVNGRDVIEQLAELGIQPHEIATVISTHYDFDHAGRHSAFVDAEYVVQRAHHSDAADNPRFSLLRSEWDQPSERIKLLDGDTQLLPGLTLIETSGHVPGHQSVLIELAQTGKVLLTADAVAFAEQFSAERKSDEPDAAGILASTIKLIELAQREQVQLVIFGHDTEQWKTLRKAPEYYE